MQTSNIDAHTIDNGPSLSSEGARYLLAPIQDKEIKDTLFSIPKDKSPGPDGYTSHFFVKAWDIVGGDVLRVIQEFFNKGKLLKRLNHAIIALVPKSKDVTKVQDYRHISCCNVVYKTIAKILARRLASVMHEVMDKAQVGFLKGRAMTHNIFMVQELLRDYGKANTSPRCMFHIDIHKAFDSISWDFLYQVLHGLKFPVAFVNWIMQCVTTTSFSISINGSPAGFFKGKKGLRQGCPLSPFLFVIGLEYLSRSLNGLNGIPEFNFHPKCREQNITHLSFADDLMLLCRGDNISINLLLQKLRDFSNVSGLVLNHSKSKVYIAGSSQSLKDQLTLEFRLGSFPFRYLGIPVAGYKLQHSHYSPFLNKLMQLVNFWKNCSLSYAGRLLLIKTVIQGLCYFWFCALSAPTSVLDQIDRISLHFLWGCRGTSNKRALVSWSRVCLPKAEGGLGVMQLCAWNQALLVKNLWDLHLNKELLWVQWVNGRYKIHNNLWTMGKKQFFFSSSQGLA